mmetsp:Transcript_67270/g.128127  ORF Transcript_67270/g.128127 Transcript_67270/m.128127 type:complete len:204 (+) Transcript_67270:164-775(+)
MQSGNALPLRSLQLLACALSALRALQQRSRGSLAETLHLGQAIQQACPGQLSLFHLFDSSCLCIFCRIQLCCLGLHARLEGRELLLQLGTCRRHLSGLGLLVRDIGLLALSIQRLAGTRRDAITFSAAATVRGNALDDGIVAHEHATFGCAVRNASMGPTTATVRVTRKLEWLTRSREDPFNIPLSIDGSLEGWTCWQCRWYL